MKIQTKTGHLTATEKRHISLLIRTNLLHAKVNRKNYLIQKRENEYTVEVRERRKREFFDEYIVDRHRASFTVA